MLVLVHWSLPDGASGKEPACRYRRHKRRGFDPWLGKIPWRRAWQPTPGFLSGEYHGQRSLAGYSPRARKESAQLSDFTHSLRHLRGFPSGASGKEPACQGRRHKRWVRSLGQEDPLEEGMATHSRILVWRIPWTEEPGGL